MRWWTAFKLINSDSLPPSLPPSPPFLHSSFTPSLSLISLLTNPLTFSQSLSVVISKRVFESVRTCVHINTLSDLSKSYTYFTAIEKLKEMPPTHHVNCIIFV